MKPSHLRTPRTLDECQFGSGLDIDRRPPIDWCEIGHDLVVAVGIVAAVVVLTLIARGVI